MLRFTKTILAGLTVGAGLILAGCQSDGKPSPNAMRGTPSTDGIACDKCKVTWVKVPITPGGGKDNRIIGYTSRKQMVCPDCNSAVANMFATGKFEHTCKACGGNMRACAVH